MLIRRYILFLLSIPLLFGVIGVIIFYFRFNHISYSIVARVFYPYALFCLSISLWIQNRTPGAVRRAVYRLPLLFVFIEAAYLIIESYFQIPGALAPAGLLGILIMVAVFVTVAGYLLILLAELGYLILIQQYQVEHANRAQRQMILRC